MSISTADSRYLGLSVGSFRLQDSAEVPPADGPFSYLVSDRPDSSDLHSKRRRRPALSLGRHICPVSVLCAIGASIVSLFGLGSTGTAICTISPLLFGLVVVWLLMPVPVLVPVLVLMSVLMLVVPLVLAALDIDSHLHRRRRRRCCSVSQGHGLS